MFNLRKLVKRKPPQVINEDKILLDMIHSELAKGKTMFIMPLIDENDPSKFAIFATNSISEYMGMYAEQRKKQQVEILLNEI